MAKKKNEKKNDFVLLTEKMSYGQQDSFVLRNKVYLYHEDARTQATFNADVRRALSDLHELYHGFEYPQFNEIWFLSVMKRHYGYMVKN